MVGKSQRVHTWRGELAEPAPRAVKGRSDSAMLAPASVHLAQVVIIRREAVLLGGWKDAEEARSRVSLEGLLALTLSGLAHAASKRRQLTVRTVLGLIVSFSCRHTHLRDFWERRPTLLPTRVLPKS